MYDYEYFDEPSEFERQIEEFKNSLVDAVKQEHKAEIDRLRSENTRLAAIEKEMTSKIATLNSELRDIEWRKKNLRTEVMQEFYQANLDDVLSSIVEHRMVWYADQTSYDREKCDLCNAERKQIALFPDGTSTQKSCDCSKPRHIYEPLSSELTFLNIKKGSPHRSSRKEFYISKSYEPNEKSRYDDFSYRDFRIQQVVETFCDDTVELHQKKQYGERIAFTSEAECQKYCDWLNEGNK